MAEGAPVNIHQAASTVEGACACDLVLLTWNRFDLLGLCVERLLRCTQLTSRLIIVDNGSTEPDVLAYLDRLRSSEQVRIEVVRRPQNGPISVALNDGLRRTSAPWICLLNNDVLVTDGWLSELIDVARSDPSIGLVNPMSNEFGLRPRPGESIDAVARRLQAHRGRWIEHWPSPGFCMLFSNTVFQEVGYWDEAFQAYFEDMDFSMRVKQAGFICVVAEGAYVYHQGGATLKQAPPLTQLYERSRQRYYTKWPGEPPQRIAYIVGDECDELSGDHRARIRALANEGHRVWVFASQRVRETIPRHSKVTPVVATVCSRGGAAYLLWRVLTKKKRFHRILAPQDLAVSRWLDRLRRIHQASVELMPSGE